MFVHVNKVTHKSSCSKQEYKKILQVLRWSIGIAAAFHTHTRNFFSFFFHDSNPRTLTAVDQSRIKVLKTVSIRSIAFSLQIDESQDEKV